METFFIGLDFSINKPAMTIYYNGCYKHFFFPLNISGKALSQYAEADVSVYDRGLDTLGKYHSDSSTLVLVNTIRSVDLASLIIDTVDSFVSEHCNGDYGLYIASEGLSFASKGSASLDLATYKGVLLAKLYELFGEHLKGLYTYSPLTLKATAHCADKEHRGSKDAMIHAYIHSDDDIPLKTALSNGEMKAKTNYVKGIDDIVDSYWVLQTMLVKENLIIFC